LQKRAEQIGSLIRQADGVVEAIGSFENPKAAFSQEVQLIQDDIKARAQTHQETGSSPAQAAGKALRGIVLEILSTENRSRYPFIQNALTAAKEQFGFRIPSIPQDIVLTLVAPHVMEVLEKATGQDHAYSSSLREDIRHHQDWQIRWGNHAAGFFADRQLYALDAFGPGVIQAVQEMLPERGEDFQKAFVEFKQKFVPPTKHT